MKLIVIVRYGDEHEKDDGDTIVRGED